MKLFEYVKKNKYNIYLLSNISQKKTSKKSFIYTLNSKIKDLKNQFKGKKDKVSKIFLNYICYFDNYFNN